MGPSLFTLRKTVPSVEADHVLLLCRVMGDAQGLRPAVQCPSSVLAPHMCTAEASALLVVYSGQARTPHLWRLSSPPGAGLAFKPGCSRSTGPTAWPIRRLPLHHFTIAHQMSIPPPPSQYIVRQQMSTPSIFLRVW